MMEVPFVRRFAGVLMACFLLWGCSAGQVYPPEALEYDHGSEVDFWYQAPEERIVGSAVKDTGVAERVVTEEELLQLSEEDPDFTVLEGLKILARLNARARYYIHEDVKAGKVLKAPNDFRAYRQWTPLPQDIPALQGVPQFILVAKNPSFLGWYENGELVGDSFICIGRQAGWTKAGLFKVREKDRNKFSRSYRNAAGVPSPMPWGLRIYGLVWIHAGDIEKANCSRGCINLPLKEAGDLFTWAKLNTPVLIIEDLKHLDTALASHSARLAGSS